MRGVYPPAEGAREKACMEIAKRARDGRALEKGEGSECDRDSPKCSYFPSIERDPARR